MNRVSKILTTEFLTPGRMKGTKPPSISERFRERTKWTRLVGY
jgi:hypothetical protein